jgi:hypothetical protein
MLGMSTLAIALLTAPSTGAAAVAVPRIAHSANSAHSAHSADATRAPATIASQSPPSPEASATATASAQVTAAINDDGAARRAFNYRRAGWQIGAAMGVGVAWYQSQIELNKLDFDFDRTWSDQWRRLSTSAGYRLDDNNPTLNVGHAFMGTIYHQFARANGGGMGEAMLFDFVTSSTWEVAVEHREVVSINDTVVTSLGGIALGEGLFQLGDYFARSEPTLVNRLLMTVFCPARGLAWLSGDRPAPAALQSDAGLAGDADHRFALAVGGAQQPGGDWHSDARLDLELVNVAAYGHAGASHRILRGGDFTRIQAQYVGGKDQMSHGLISARATMWGRYDQHATLAAPALGADPAPVRGVATFVGSATAFDLSSDQLAVSNDFVAAVHILGPTVDATVFHDQWTFRAAADLFPDFALVRPFALREVPTGVARAGMKSTLQDSDYYYAFGVASAARLEAAFRRARAGVGVSYSHHDSIEGLDRHQKAYTSPTGIQHEAISRDDDLTDQRLKLRLFSDAPLPITDVTLGVSLDYQRRSGTGADLRRAADDLRWGVHATYAM